MSYLPDSRRSQRIGKIKVVGKVRHQGLFTYIIKKKTEGTEEEVKIMQKDIFKDKFITDSLYGHMTTDYFEFFCGKCKSMVEVEFLGTDLSAPNFKATCPDCGEIGVFKTRVKNMYNRNH